MSVAIRAITRLQDADDLNVALGVGVDEYALCWDNDTARFVLRAPFAGLLATGATVGATSEAQAFTNGIVAPSWKPSSDSATALQLKNAAGTTLVSLDTTLAVLQLHDTTGSKYAEIRGMATSTSLGIGLNCLAFLTGANNVAIGYDSAKSLTTGYNNVAVGVFAFRAANTGHSSVAVGYQALYTCTSGAFNMAVGRQALYSLTTGQYNTGIGYQTAYYTTSGGNNLALGASALQRNTTGSYNIAIGSLAGAYQANGSTALADPENSIYIGANTRGFNNDDSNSIVIGYGAIGIGANKTVIGSTSTTMTALFGALRIPQLAAAPTGEAGHTLIYAKDNGSGKTQLCCKLGDDVEIVLATQA